tara:strand:- start:3403 stop:4104 length:702 start_codon:yes stop_codon:yes gene_type:complete
LIKNKKILITGNTSGLGYALTNLLLSKKNKVFSLSRRRLKKRKNLKSVICNLKKISTIKYKLKKLINTKNIDYVFLNAGILGKIKRINKIHFNEINEIFKINVFANKEILDYLIKNKIKTKLIIGISSGAALYPKFGWYLYCGSKAAFKFLIESYANEEPRRKFINISPGLIKTKMQGEICKINEKKISSVKKFKKLNRLNKVPLPEDVALNILNKVTSVKRKSGSYLDIRQK